MIELVHSITRITKNIPTYAQPSVCHTQRSCGSSPGMSCTQTRTASPDMNDSPIKRKQRNSQMTWTNDSTIATTKTEKFCTSALLEHVKRAAVTETRSLTM